jgi:murein L,D-transpeptidase YcbB/YkuD
MEGRLSAPERDNWHYPFQRFDPSTLFRDLDERGPDGVLGSLEAREWLPPSHEAEALRDSLWTYRRIAETGGWPQIEGGDPLAAGDRGERVRTLRRRLMATGDLPESGDSDLYDAELEEGVRRFQGRHGLEPDGRVGRRTLEAMNVPVADRIQQIEMNLERSRWLPPVESDELLWINIPEFRLRAFRDGREVLGMPVVVGTPETPTPTFYERVQYAVLNPDWIVPESIALREVLPKAHEDPGYLQRAEFELLDDAGSPMSLDELSIDLLRSGRHRIRRKPGPWNDLGRIKFMFPNEFQIYLHDTPSRGLFLRASRAFSHGCVRVGEPLELARFLFGSRFDQLRVELEAGLQREIPIESPVPLYIVYFTAWRESDGTVQFRDDVYDRDRALASELLAERAPLAGEDDTPLLWPSVD